MVARGFTILLLALNLYALSRHPEMLAALWTRENANATLVEANDEPDVYISPASIESDVGDVLATSALQFQAFTIRMKRPCKRYSISYEWYCEDKPLFEQSITDGWGPKAFERLVFEFPEIPEGDPRRELPLRVGMRYAATSEIDPIQRAVFDAQHSGKPLPTNVRSSAFASTAMRLRLPAELTLPDGMTNKQCGTVTIQDAQDVVDVALYTYTCAEGSLHFGPGIVPSGEGSISLVLRLRLDFEPAAAGSAASEK